MLSSPLIDYNDILATLRNFKKKWRKRLAEIEASLGDESFFEKCISSFNTHFMQMPETICGSYSCHHTVRLSLPTYMCIDESYSFKSEDSSYVCMFVDFETGEPIDILPSRRKEVLLEYFRKIPLEERRNVRIVGIDMWNTYRSVVKELFPRVLLSADHFEFYNLLINWSQEIINSFTMVGSKRINNSYIESRNNQIEKLFFNANGFMNFKRTRNRILYCLNKKDTYKL